MTRLKKAAAIGAACVVLAGVRAAAQARDGGSRLN